MKKFMNSWLDEHKEQFYSISDKIWELAEMRFCERNSAAMLMRTLSEAGFTVENNLAGMETAFVASYGSGKPIIAVLGEYDALAGLSQQPLSTTRTALQNGAPGHGCGHNLLGTACLAGIMALKELMDSKQLTGTIRYYGCPGEEGGSGKAFMARSGAFDDLDIALTWHPFGNNAVISVSMLANFQVSFKFKGLSAHAAASPHLGRSALDAVELMNVGVNYLREHVIPEARMHYAITNTGGSSPNVVQPEAEVLYLLRAPQLQEVREIYLRVCDIAKGAALMTGTTVEILFEKACSNFIPNKVVENVVYQNMLAVGAPHFDDRDREFAAAMAQTLSATDINNELSMAKTFMGRDYDPAIIETLTGEHLSQTILPYAYHTSLLPGSSDVGDVSWIAPTAQFAIACQAFGTPSHSWQLVSQGVSSIAHKGLLTAAKVLANSMLDLLQSPELVHQAKIQHEKTLGANKYISPIPADIQPKPFGK